MIECPSTQFNAHRLLRPNRPTSLVRGDQENQARPRMRLRSASNPTETLCAILEAVALIIQAGASLPITSSADSALSP
jgi:hypothetical protein